MDMQLHRAITRFTDARAIARSRWLLALGAACLSTVGHAAVYRCVDSNGVSTYADHPCAVADAAPAPAKAAPAGHPAAPPSDNRVLSEREIRARDALMLLHLAPDSANPDAGNHLIDLITPDLVQQLDPGNGHWNPQNSRWHSVSDFVKADLRRDVGPALRVSDAETMQAAARQYAARAKDTDIEQLLVFLRSGDGAQYIAFQNVLRSIVNQSLQAIMMQEPVTAASPTDETLKQRQRLLVLSLDARIANDGGGPPPPDASAGSHAVLDNTVRREGTALDALYAEYEHQLPAFETFTRSATAKSFFTEVDPAVRTVAALMSVAGNGFADNEQGKFANRWQSFYGPPLRSARTTVSRYGNVVSVSSTNTNAFNSKARGAESMALQCEQRETAAYNARYSRGTDPVTQQNALKDIQDRCRNEQNLASY